MRAGVLLILLAGMGCTGSGVSVRADGSPGPQKCPPEALKAMEYLQLHPGDSGRIEIDANQNGYRPISLNDGPVESFLRGEGIGWLPFATRLYGQIWTGGPNVVIRYYTARVPDSGPIPICAVAQIDKAQMRKPPDSKPGNVWLEVSKATVYIVDEFR